MISSKEEFNIKKRLGLIPDPLQEYEFSLISTEEKNEIMKIARNSKYLLKGNAVELHPGWYNVNLLFSQEIKELCHLCNIPKKILCQKNK